LNGIGRSRDERAALESEEIPSRPAPPSGRPVSAGIVASAAWPIREEQLTWSPERGNLHELQNDISGVALNLTDLRHHCGGKGWQSLVKVLR
jgi:hypothetical protein